MGNLVYILVVIAYFIWQAMQARKRNAAQEEAKKNADQPGRMVREVAPPTMEERMRDIFREVEMKNKPYAKPDKPVQRKIAEPAKVQSISKPVPKVEKKKPSPFLDVDMTQEESAPEGTWTPMGEERFSKSGYDYNKAAPVISIRKVNLRDAVIAKIILDRPEW